MRYITICCMVSASLLLTGCSKSDDNPVNNNTNTKGGISGSVKNAISSTALAGIKVTLTQTGAKTTTDNSGSYSFTNLDAGTYSITITDAGYKTLTNSNIQVTAGNTATSNALIQPYIWKTANSDNNATVALPLSINPNINDTPLTAGDAIGCFYDSLGTTACAGYSELTSASAVAITLWGDDGATSGKKEGFSAGDAIVWKVKRKSDGKVFDAAATYKTGSGTYQANALYEITKLTISAE